MKKIIINTIKSILFFVILIVILNPINQLYMENSNINDRRTIQEIQFESFGSETKVITMGSSHTQTAFNPTYFPNSFNLGLPGEDIIKNYYRFKYMLEHNLVNITTVLLEICMHRFFVIQKNIFNNRWYYAQYIPLKGYIDLSLLNENITVLDALEEKIRGTYPVIGKGSDLLNILLRGHEKTNYSILTKGYRQFMENFSDSDSKEKKREVTETIKRHFGSEITNPILIDYFKKFIELAKQYNISTILIRYPLTQEYINATRTHIQNITTFYDDILVKINASDLIVLNYQNIFINQTNKFKDSDHLNKWGAEILTKQIKMDLEKI